METEDFKKLHKRVLRQVGRAIADFAMIEAGDRIMACLSGGKDSYVMLDTLLELQRKAPIHFDVVAVNLDQGHPGFPKHVLPDFLESIGVSYKIYERDTYSIVQDKITPGKTTCSLCSRLRRGILYGAADELNCNKLALGHHRDDLLETLFLNMFYNGQLKAMPPKLRTDAGRHVVIRPLAYVKESEAAAYAAHKAFPIIPCNLCGSQETLKRQSMKQMLQKWESDDPGRLDVIFASLGSVKPSHLADPELFDFKSLRPDPDAPSAWLPWGQAIEV